MTADVEYVSAAQHLKDSIKNAYLKVVKVLASSELLRMQRQLELIDQELLNIISERRDISFFMHMRQDVSLDSC